MARLPFSVSGLIGLVAVCALGLVSLRTPTVWWTSAAAAVTLALLLTGVLGGAFLRGPERGYWSGFALFGGVFLLLVNWDWFGGQFGHDLTGGLSDLADVVLPPIVSPTAGLPPAVVARGPGRALGPSPAYIDSARDHALKVGNFVQIGRMGFSLLFALLGGLIGRIFNDRAGPAV